MVGVVDSEKVTVSKVLGVVIVRDIPVQFWVTIFDFMSSKVIGPNS